MTFTLPRRGREPFDENRPQIRHFIALENAIMSALESAVAELKSAIENANSRFQNVGDVEEALAAERARNDELVAKYAALVEAEDAEDVTQNEELNTARAATDSALAELQGAADVLSGLTRQVNELGTVAEAPQDLDGGDLSDEEPVVDAPVETPVDVPVEEPVAAPVETDTDVPADAEPTPEPAPVDAPVDTPVDTPVADAPANAAPVSASGPQPPMSPNV